MSRSEPIKWSEFVDDLTKVQRTTGLRRHALRLSTETKHVITKFERRSEAHNSLTTLIATIRDARSPDVVLPPSTEGATIK